MAAAFSHSVHDTSPGTILEIYIGTRPPPFTTYETRILPEHAAISSNGLSSAFIERILDMPAAPIALVMTKEPINT